MSPSTLLRTLWVWLFFVMLATAPAGAAVVRETVFFDVPVNLALNPNPTPTAQLSNVVGYPPEGDRLTLIGLLYRPDPVVHGPGPYPAVIILHGSGGMWSGDAIANGPTNQTEKWGQMLAGRGFLCLAMDSYNPRGIPGNFSNRRPHHDSGIDDAACSPNYERPKDVVAALTYLDSRTDLDREHVGLLGFSHGSQAGLNAILDSSVDLGAYTVDYTNVNNQTVKLAVPAPVRVPASLPFPKVCIFYYPGCGHSSYHGSPNSVAAGRYMPDRRTRVLMFHGTNDSLMGVTDPNAAPKTGSLFPIKFVLASLAQATAVGVPTPFVAHHIFHLVNHTFDDTTIEPQGNWNTPAESADEKANRLAQAETLKWFDFRLRRHVLTPEPDAQNPGQYDVAWLGREQLRYQLLSGTSLIGWGPDGIEVIGQGAPLASPVTIPQENRQFYRLRVEPVAPPTTDPLYSDFFLEYADFSY